MYCEALLFSFSSPCINKESRDIVLEMRPQPERHWALLVSSVSVCCITIWNISSPSVVVRHRYEKSHFPLYLSHSRARMSATSASLPRHNNPGQCPCASRQVLVPTPQRLPPSPAHLARLSLWQIPSSIAPVTVILAGSSLCDGASHRGNRLLDYEPDVLRLTHGNTKGRRISSENKRGRGKLCSHFLSFICSWSFSPTVP